MIFVKIASYIFLLIGGLLFLGAVDYVDQGQDKQALFYILMSIANIAFGFWGISL